jgi:hypothetical protein
MKIEKMKWVMSEKIQGAFMEERHLAMAVTVTPQ